MAGLTVNKEDVRRVLDKYGRSSLDYYKLWDKQYKQLGPEAVAAYGSTRGAIIVLENPIGPRGELSMQVDALVRFAGKQHKSLAFLEVGPIESKIYRSKGFTVIKIGEVARVRIEHFLQFYLHDRNFRYKRNRCKREGYHLQIIDPPLSDGQYDALEDISYTWLSERNRHEQGFASGYFEREYIQNTRSYALLDKDGRVIAFTTRTPSYRKGELIIDVVRYLPGLANGALEYLVMEIIRQANRENYIYLSLGITPMAGISNPANIYERMMAFYYQRFTWPLNVRGLREFKAQFQPEWESRFIACKGGVGDFIRIGLAAAKLVNVKDRG